MTKRFIKLRRVLAGGCAALALGVASADAQNAPAAPQRFLVRAWPDGAIVGAVGALTVVPEAFKADLPHATCAPCDPSGLWGIDRGILGPERRGAARASDAALLGAGGLAALLLIRDRRGEGREAAAGDLVVFVEAVGAAGAAGEWAKVLFHRARPECYNPGGACATSPDAGLSFPSGHATGAFAAAAAFASILHRRGALHDHKTELAALLALASATGVLRVVAREHFPTDVMAGAVLGGAIGWAVPALHAQQ